MYLDVIFVIDVDPDGETYWMIRWESINPDPENNPIVKDAKPEHFSG